MDTAVSVCANAKHASTWNVVSEENFKERIEYVFGKVSESLAKTLGPYGSTTIIERFGEMYITKDGWNVLKNIRFNDPIDNNIMALLLRISAQVVIQVGDGSTSSIVAANEILKLFEENKEFLSSIRPKDLMSKLNDIVTRMSSAIYESSTKIDDSNNFDEIYRIATIATNGDTVIPEMIREIYVKTGNPTIEYRESKTNDTTFEITDGYALNHATFIDNIFATNDDSTCIVNKPYILLFDYKIDTEHSLDLISLAAARARDENRKLVVFAPHYDNLLMDRLRRSLIQEFRDKGDSLCVYCRVSLTNNMTRVMYNDFAVMAGATIFHEQFDDQAQQNELKYLDESIGFVEKMVISENNTVISGFTSRNETLYSKIIADANNKYATLEEEYRERGIVDPCVTDAKNRVTKLRGSMGIIRVGGISTLEKRANYDLVEDAVKACESAYCYGYNIGGCLIIPYTISKLLSTSDFDEDTRTLMGIIYNAFINVFRRVLINKSDDVEWSDKIIKAVVAYWTDNDELYCYDLVEDTITDSIINPCRTDIEILRAAVSVISLLYTSNQYLSVIDTQQK